MVPAMDTPDSDNTDQLPELGERIAKRLARAGLCSRRDAERWIAEGRIAVNGTVLDSPAFVVRPGDIVMADGKPIPEPEPARLWRYHKPAGLVTSARDEKGRATVFDKLPDNLPRVVSIGRLDLTTEGLLLLTNDGELARFLEMPTTGWTRRYRVRVFGEVDPVALANLQNGPVIEGVKYGPIEATLDRIQGRNAWLSVALKEGKNREIRRVMESMGLQVNRLIRVSYGPFQLGKLEEGAVEEVPKRVVREQIAPFFTGGTMSGDPDAAPSGKGSKGGKASPAKALRTEAPVKDVDKAYDRKADAGKKAPSAARPGQSRAGLERDDSFKSGGAKAGWAKADKSSFGKSHGARSSGPRAALARTGVSERPSDDVRNEDRRNEGRKTGFRPDVTPEDVDHSDAPRRTGKPTGRKSFGEKAFGAKVAGQKSFDGKPGSPRKRESGEKAFGEKSFGEKSFGKKTFGDKPDGGAGKFARNDSRGEGRSDSRKGGFRADGIRSDSEQGDSKRGDRRVEGKGPAGKGPTGKSFGGKPGAPRKRKFGEGGGFGKPEQARGQDRKSDGERFGSKPFAGKGPRPARDGGPMKPGGKPGGKPATGERTGGERGGERGKPFAAKGPRREGRPGADRRR